MIRRIRLRFIRIAVLVLALAMVLVAAVINVVNWANTRAELEETLTYLTQHEGRGDREPRDRGKRGKGFRDRLNESRFFSVYAAADGEIALNDISRVTDYGTDELTAIAERALDSGRSSGFLEDYLFSVTDASGDRRFVVLLNCETKLAAIRQLALVSAAACAGGVLLAWLLVALFSRRAIQPMIDNALQQKQFITDAGHELKTPLTVISANMDVLVLESGDSEWIRSTRKQVANMRELVGELIYLSRLDEESYEVELKPLDLSALLRDAAASFEGMAEFSGKALKVNAGDAIEVRGDEAMLRRLVSVLCDNAVKYAPEGDVIEIALREDGRRATLTVENGLVAPLPPETLKRLFDRFYRADESRSRESGGYGIGLSVARAIVERHGGDIRAEQTPGGRLRFTVVLPKGGASARG